MRDNIELRSGMVFRMNWPHREPDRIVVVEMFSQSIGNVYSVNGGNVYETDVRELYHSIYSDVERVITVPDPWFLRGDMVTFTGDSDPMVVLRDMSLEGVVYVRDIGLREFTLPHDKLTLIGKVPTKSPSVYIDDSGHTFFILGVDYDNWTIKAFDNKHLKVVMLTLEDFAALDLHIHYS